MVAHLRRLSSGRAAAWLALAWLAGCVAPPAPAPTGAGPQAGAPSIAVPPGARVFDVDPAHTSVTVLVYRAGPFARLGHNHAITCADERGVVWLGTSPASSGFEIHVPVAAFVVDDPQARAAAGPEFPGVVPEDARRGTTGNMLRPEVLDVAHFPEVVVRADGASGDWQQALVHVAVRVKDVERAFDVPVALTVSRDSVTARGNFQLRQTDFGITPFAVAGGAIQVADGVEVRFVISATARR